MRRSQACLAAIFALVLVFAAAAQGEMITFAFSGTITSVSETNNALDGAVQENDFFHGTYTFDSLAPDLDPRSGYGKYNFPNGGLNITLGDLTLTIPGPQLFIYVSDRLTSDAYTVGGLGVSSAGLWIPEFPISATLDSSAFNSEALPLVPPAPDLFLIRELHFSGSKPGVGDFTIHGTFDSLSPEPGSVVLLLAGFALALRRQQGRAMVRWSDRTTSIDDVAGVRR